MNITRAGDLHSLLVSGSIGTNSNPAPADRPTFKTGFDARVGGQIGQISSGDSMIGGVDAIHAAVHSAFGANIEEVEGRNINSVAASPAAGWFTSFLEGDASVNNDTYATAQALASYPGKKGRSTVTVFGQLQATGPIADYVDYYSMSLLAGQAMTVQLSGIGGIPTAGLLNVGIYDPDGRLVATDYPNVGLGVAVAGQPVRFVADRPGLYRIAVAVAGDADFNGPGGEFGTVNVGNVPYQVAITGAGNVGIGGILAGNNIQDGQDSDVYGFFVENGDMGGIEAGGSVFSSVTSQSVVVRKGSLRSISGASIGLSTGGALNGPQIGDGMDLVVPRGNVGLIRSTQGIVALNPLSLVPVGGDYQVVSAAGTLASNIYANRAIGVIRAGDMITLTPSVFTANADLQGADGVIDLIDVQGDMGTLQSGGPAISTGPGGDVRYIHVGGTVYRDFFFGGGTPEATTYAPGEKVHLTDDSGSKIDLEPFPLMPNPAFIPGGTNPAQIGPTLTVTAYGIRSSGGVAVVNVTSTGSVRVGGGGGGKAHVEIGTLKTTGIGNPVLRDAITGNLIFDQPTTASGTNLGQTLDILINGSAKVDVFKIEGSDFTSIVNKTRGEIVNIDATVNPVLPVTPGFTNNGTIGTLQGTSFGTAEHHTGAAVNGLDVVQNVFPFNQQHNAVISGNIMNIETSGGVGNLAVTGNVGNIFANSGGRHSTDAFEGISGPLVVSGNLNAVNIGEGILPSGSGNLSQAGIYVGGLLGSVENQGLTSDIRGNIVSNGGIGSIDLSNGAIIGARVMNVTTFDQSRRFTNGFMSQGGGGPISNPIFDIGEINVGGAGGIIGSLFVANSIGPVKVVHGFGIFSSAFVLNGNGRQGGISAEGYGIRGSFVAGGASLTSLSATAKPKNVSVLNYTPSVRQSERHAIDPFFQQAPSIETDLHVYLGTSARKPRIKSITDTGVIEDTTVVGSRDLGSVFASQIRQSPTGFVAMRFNLANSIGSIKTRGEINGLGITTGSLKNFYSGGNATGVVATVAGRITTFHVNGDLDETSNIAASGPSGSIGQFIIDGSLNGDVSASDTFDLLAVGKDLGATSLVTAKSLTKKQIRGNIFGTIRLG
jgi:hypothetical protein